MPAWLTEPAWSPYVVGAAIGVLSWLTFLLSDRPIGITAGYVRTGGMLECLVRGKKAAQRPYFQKFPPQVQWDWLILVGVVAGGFLSAWLAGSFSVTWVPAQWAESFGLAPWPRIGTALIGGVVLGIGSRWAGGCTSGHGISGGLQMAVSSWLAVVCFFAGGTGTALLLYRVLG